MVDHELNELRREFLDEARGKVSEMQSALEGAPAPAPETLDRLTYLAHQLKGSGGSYGYERISTDAAELEKALEKVADDGGTFSDLEPKIQQHVVNLRSEIDRCARELVT
jgi:HPt (histidine-containing phosphotransfer) domain-containing protein